MTFDEKYKAIFGKKVQPVDDTVAQSLLFKLQKARIVNPLVNNVSNQISEVYRKPQSQVPSEPITIPQRDSIGQRIGSYIAPQERVRGIDIVREIPEAGFNIVSAPVKKLFDFIDKGGAQTLNILASPIEAIASKLAGDPELKTSKDVWDRVVQNWQDRAIEIGHPLEEIFKPNQPGKGMGVYTEKLLQVGKSLAQTVMDKNSSIVDKAMSLGGLIGLGTVDFFANPFYLTSIKGLYKGSFQIDKPTKALILQGMFNSQESEALKALGLRQGATEQEINLAFRRIANESHPDKLKIKLGRTATVDEQLIAKATYQGANNARNYLLGKIKEFKPEIPGTRTAESVVSEIPELPARQIPSLKTIERVPQLGAAISKGAIVPSATNVAFQMMDPTQIKTAKTLQTKLETQLKKKQKLIETTRANDPSIQKIQTVIQNLQNSIRQAENKKIVATGPERTLPMSRIQEQVKNIPITIKQETKPLYHGSYEGMFKIDRQGNINLSSNKNEISQFGEPVKIDTSNLKIKTFETKRELFDAVQNKQDYEQYDILQSGNHAIAINPKSFANKTGSKVIDLLRQTIIKPEKISKYREAVTKEGERRAKRYVEKVKEEQFKKNLEELQKERATKVKLKPIEETPWKKRQITKEEYEALESRKKAHKKERKVKTYVERVKERALQLKKKDEINVQLAKERIMKIRKERELAGGVSAEQMMREESLLKGLQQFEDQTGRIVNNQKVERLSKMEIEINELNKQLIEAKKANKDETYFRDLDVKLFSDFLEGRSKIDKSEIVSRFIDDNFGVGKAEKYSEELLVEKKSGKPEILQSRIFFLPSEIANSIDDVWQKIIGNKAYSGFEWFMDKLSEIKIKTPSIKTEGGVKISYPFEFIFGTKQRNLRPYDRQLQKGLATVKNNVFDLAKKLAKFSKDEQSIILKKIEEMDYSHDKLGEMAKETESFFVQAGYDLVKRGLMKESTFREYLGKYFPRMYEAFDESNNIAYSLLRKRMSNKPYAKLRKDAYGVIYRGKEGKIIKKFETRQERDQFIKDNLQNKKYETFAPLKEEKIAELKRIEKLPYVVVSRLMQEMTDVVIYDYLSALSKDKNIVLNVQDIDKGFVNQVPKTPAYGELGGKYVHQWYYQDVRDLIELPNSIDRGLRLFNGIIKGFKTILDPAVGTANAISNLFLADMAGVPIERVDYWTRNLYNSLTNKGAYKILSMEGVTKQTYAIEEIEKFMKISENEEELKSLLYNDSKLSSFDLVSTLYSLVKKGWIKAGDLYSFSEDWAKSVAFDWATNELGMGREDAIQFANDAIFNYSEVSRALKLLRRFPFGAAFPTFTAKLLGQMVKQQIRKPFTIAKWHFILGSIAAASLAAHEITKEDLKRIKPESVGSWFIVTDVKRDTRGNIIDIQLTDLSRYLPWGQVTSMPIGIDSPLDLVFNPEFLTQTQRGEAKVMKGQNILSAFMPGQLLIKPVSELMLNHSQFTNSEIYPDDATPVEKMFAWIDYLETSWLPSWTPPLTKEGKGGYMYQKLHDSFLQIPDFQGRIPAINEALLRIIGTKISHIRPENEFSFLLSDITKDIKMYNSKIFSEESRYEAALENREATRQSKNQAQIRYNEKIKLYEEKLEALQDEYDVIDDAQIKFEKNVKKQ